MSSHEDRVEEIFAKVCQLPSGARTEHLNEYCQGDKELRQIVESRLAAFDALQETQAPDSSQPATASTQEISSFLPGVAKDSCPPTEPEQTVRRQGADPGRTGQTIGGRYTLDRRLGEGGMGEVWIAHQSEPVDRDVAIKLIKTGMDSSGVLARFEQERQALAVMDHPNIARVFDGGITSTGQPYFVMELVDGQTLDEYCDNQGQSLDDRLRIFVSICQAIQHAHQKGVIHRDLKPANILVATVDEAPLPKVIDFGVAKATTGKLNENSLQTQSGAVVGTLEYMSPEQANPSTQDIDTRADIYALGVILYELLTGLRPLKPERLRTAALSDVLYMICEEVPNTPSTRLSKDETLESCAESRKLDPSKLMAQLRGDLDWIVMKCLEKDRNRRYESATALRRDVERYLAGEPVEACPPSLGYRARKFCLRHKGAMFAAGSILAVLIVGIVGTSIALYNMTLARAAEAEQRVLAVQSAEEEAEARKRAEEVAQLLEAVFDNLDPATDQELGQTFAEQMVANLRQLVLDLEHFSGDSLAKARLQMSFGSSLMGLGKFNEAETMFRSAAQLRKEGLRENDPSIIDAQVALATAVQRQGRYVEAIGIVEQVRDIVSRHADTPNIELDHLLGMIYQAAGRIREALPLFEAAHASLLRDPQPDSQPRLLTLHTLGAAYREMGRNEEAVKLLEDVLARRGKLLGDSHAQTLITANSLAVAYSQSNRLQESLDLHDETRRRLIERFGPKHASVFNSAMNRAMTLWSSGKTDQAIEQLEELYLEATASLGERNIATLRIVATLANARFEDGKVESSLDLLNATRTNMEAVLTGPNSVISSCDALRARCLAATGNVPEAIQIMEAAISQKIKQLGDDHSSVFKLQRQLATIYRQNDRLEEAIEMLKKIKERQIQLFGASSNQLDSTLMVLGKCYFEQKEAKLAIECFEQAVEGMKRHLGPTHPSTLLAQGNLGSSYWLDQQFDRSIPILESLLKLMHQVVGDKSERTLSIAMDLAVNYQDSEQRDDLYQHLRKWFAPMLREFGSRHETLSKLIPIFLRECKARNQIANSIGVLEVIVADVSKQVGLDHPTTLQMTNNLAAAYWHGKQLDRSIPMFEELVKRSKRILGETSLPTLQRTGSYARNLIDADRAAEAIPLLQDALAKARQRSQTLAPPIAFLQRDMGKALGRVGRKEEAREALAVAVKEARQNHVQGSVLLARDLAGIAVVLLNIEAFEDAQQLLQESLDARQKHEPDTWTTFNTQSALGGALFGQGKLTEAEPLLLEGYHGMAQRLTQIPPQGMQRIVQALDRLVTLSEANKDNAAAAKWKKRRLDFETQQSKE